MRMNQNDTRKIIESGKTALGIEFGSTRIKAVLIGEDHAPIGSGSYEWENRYENGVWTYYLEDVWTGLQESFQNLNRDVLEKYNTPLKTIGAIGFSAMMHGYMAFDREGNLLVPFRTWRNTITEDAAEKLTELFQFSIPQRWSIAPLPGDFEQRTACQGYSFPDHAGRLCALETDGAKGVGRWRSLGHVSNRQPNQWLR
jgi:hypothetical protein